MYRCNFNYQGSPLFYKELDNLPSEGQTISFGTDEEYTVERVVQDLNNVGNVLVEIHPYNHLLVD